MNSKYAFYAVLGALAFLAYRTYQWKSLGGGLDWSDGLKAALSNFPKSPKGAAVNVTTGPLVGAVTAGVAGPGPTIVSDAA